MARPRSTRSTARPADAGTRSCGPRAPTRLPASRCSASRCDAGVRAQPRPRRRGGRPACAAQVPRQPGVARQRRRPRCTTPATSRAADDGAGSGAGRPTRSGPRTLLRAGHRVIGLGGGHEIAWASYQGIAAGALQDDQRLARLGIVNFDAHFDLRQPEQAGRGSSGTPFLQIAAVARGGRARLPVPLPRRQRDGKHARTVRAGRRVSVSDIVPDVDIADAAVDATPARFRRRSATPSTARSVSTCCRPRWHPASARRLASACRCIARSRCCACCGASAGTPPGGDRLVLADIAELQPPVFDAPDATHGTHRGAHRLRTGAAVDR